MKEGAFSLQNRELYYLTKKEKNTKARLGELRLAHGVVQTPVFMPVGTIGTVKTMSSIEMAKIGYELILNNTLHLFLRPGLDIIKEFKGIKNMIRWNKNLLTDSGGYQVFSLSDFRHINDDGVIFKDPMTGSKHFFNPEIVIDIQKIIGSDIIMPLDECTPTSVD
ncbi:MAG TPA: tRNA guanosine(34) transglycosylase Tgt, partial [Spirochaetia bacterium]|nr:tRNA guanosine(34) transglycosylase Tgt [Spirochaetia bacterium]